MHPATPPCSPTNAMNANAEAPAVRASKRNANNAAAANRPRARLSAGGLEQAFENAVNTPAAATPDEDMLQVNGDSAATATANNAAAAEAAASARPAANSEEPPPPARGTHRACSHRTRSPLHHHLSCTPLHRCPCSSHGYHRRRRPCSTASHTGSS